MATAPDEAVLDDFNRSDEGPPPSSAWTTGIFGGSNGMRVASNLCAPPSGAGTGEGYWNAGVTSDAAEDEVYFTMTTGPSVMANGDTMRIYLRLADIGATVDGYTLEFNFRTLTDRRYFRRIDDGTATQVGSRSDLDMNDGDKLAITCDASATAFDLYHDVGAGWVFVTSWAESTYQSAGFLGVSINSVSTFRLDDFGGGPFAVAPQTVALSSATLAGSAPALSVIPGGVVAVMNEVALAGAPQAMEVSLAAIVGVNALTATLAAQTSTILPGAISVGMIAPSLVSTAQPTTINALVSLLMGALTIAVAAQTGVVISGGTTIQMLAAILASSPQGLTVNIGILLLMNALTTVSSSQAVTVLPGETILSMMSPTLVGSAQTMSVESSIALLMNAVTLSGSPQSMNILPGGTQISMGVPTIISSAQAMSLIPGAISIPMLAAMLLSSVETMIVVPGDVNISMQVLDLIGALQNASVISGETVVPLFAIPLTVEAQNLFVVIGITPNVRGFVSVIVEINYSEVRVLPHEHDVDILLHGSDAKIPFYEGKVEILPHESKLRTSDD